jgi:hypothetical protein
MKFLLVLTMLAGSAFANASNPEWAVKCFEKDHHDFDLAYVIKVEKDDMTFDRELQLLDCTRGDEAEKANCRERGELKKIERQEESCLVLKRHDSRLNNDKFSLCHQEQETTFNPRRLVPVTVTDDRQESRIYCEREILRLL